MTRNLPLPSKKRLNELFDYNEKTGVLTNRISWGRRQAGAVVGRPDRCGALQAMVDGKLYLVHRLIWKMKTGKDPRDTVDHKNRRPGSNSWRNLRPADMVQQCMNRKRRSTNSSGTTGVNRVTGGWVARITVRGKRCTLGRFKRKRDAVQARNNAEIRYHKQWRVR